MEKFKTVLFLDNSKTAEHLYKQIIKNKKYNLISVVNNGNQKFIQEIKNPTIKSFTFNLRNSDTIKKYILKQKPEIGFSYFDKKIPKEIFSNFIRGIINFHPSYLPYNKGRHSAFWAIYKNTPIGATAHWIDEKFDNGDIFFQKKIELNIFCSAKDVYNNQIKLINKIINKTLNLVSKKIFNKKKQKKLKNSYHFKDDILKEITFNSTTKLSTKKLIKIIRGTCYKNNGFFIKKNNTFYKIMSKYSYKKIKIKKNIKSKIILNDFLKNKLNKYFLYSMVLGNYVFRIRSKIKKL